MSKAEKVQPKKCACGAEPVITKPKAGQWAVSCSANTRPLGSHWVVGHTMFTQKEAIRVWNELNEETV